MQNPTDISRRNAGDQTARGIVKYVTGNTAMIQIGGSSNLLPAVFNKDNPPAAGSEVALIRVIGQQKWVVATQYGTQRSGNVVGGSTEGSGIVPSAYVADKPYTPVGLIAKPQPGAVLFEWQGIVASTNIFEVQTSVLGADSDAVTVLLTHGSYYTRQATGSIYVRVRSVSPDFRYQSAWTTFVNGTSLADPGYIVGPGSAVDHTLPRFDATTGKLVEGSNTTLSDTDDLDLPGILTTHSGKVIKERVVTIAGAVTITTADDLVVVNKTVGAATVVNLPATPTTGQTFIVHDGKGDAATNNITITPAAGNINGGATLVINANYGTAVCTYNGTQWDAQVAAGGGGGGSALNIKDGGSINDLAVTEIDFPRGTIANPVSGKIVVSPGLTLLPITARYKTATAHSLPGGYVPTIINFDLEIFDTDTAVTTGASWHFTAPRTGYYHVDMSLLLDGTATFQYVNIFVNGSDIGALMAYGAQAYIEGSDTVYLVAGDTLDLRLSATNNLTIHTDAQWNHINIFSIGDTGVIGGILPNHAVVWHDELISTVGGPGSSWHDPLQNYGSYSYQTPPAPADERTGSVYLTAGTYTLNVLGVPGTNCGIFDWYIDGVLVVTGQDWYSATFIYNTLKSNSVTVIGNGIHVVKSVCTGKNASSTNYYNIFTKLWFMPSADVMLLESTEPDRVNSSICNGRLTLSSGTPITITDITAATTLYFTPFRGNQIGTYNGFTWSVHPFAEQSLSLSGFTANSNYDVFIVDGTLALEAVIWTNDTTRATALVLQDGIYVKSGAATRRYLGTIRIVATGQCEDSALRRFVYNYYNLTNRLLSVVETTGNWNYSSSTIRPANGNSANIIEIVNGIPEGPICVEYSTNMEFNGSNDWGVTGIGENSLSVIPARCILGQFRIFSTSVGMRSSHISTYKVIPQLGYSYFSMLEQTVAGTVTFFGSDNTGLSAEWMS